MQRCEFSVHDLPGDVYADDIGGVDNLGTNFRTIFVTYTRLECGLLKPVPVLCVVRPQSSILVKGGAISRMLKEQGPPGRNGNEGMRMHS